MKDAASSAISFENNGPVLDPRSTNHKADLVNQYLRELKIAYQVMRRHPAVLKEFVEAVKMGANPPEPVEVSVKKQHEGQQEPL